MWLFKTDKNPILAKARDMKKSVKPLFSILVLIVFVATLSYRVALRRVLVISFQLDGFATVPVFNSTLLRLASADPNLERNKQEIAKLLDGNFNSLGRYRLRSYSNWRRYNRMDTGPNRGTRQSYQIGLQSPGFYRYWLDFRKHLQNWWRRKNFEPDVMLELVNLVKGAIESSRMSNGSSSSSYLGRASKKYSSCAVVGNSGILLKNEHGDLIDSHEFVIRLNNARIETFGKNVGTKTSISFVNSNILNYCARREGCFCHPYGANVPIIMYICQAIHFFDYTLCEKSHKAPLLITDPRFDVLCARIVKYYSLKRFVEETGKPVEEWDLKNDVFEFHYSSGMQAVMLALGICDKVSLFGFGKSDSAKHHYHTNQKAELKLHDYEAEYSFYHDAINRPRAVPFISDKFKFPPMVMHQ